jgi:antagonist of KipI
VLDGSAIDNWRPFSVSKGSVLSFKTKRAGNRSYLAVARGFDIEDWLGSASTNFAAKVGGLFGRALRAGDEIKLRSTSKLNLPASPGKISHSLVPKYCSNPTVRLIAGAEFDCLSNDGRKAFLKNEFTISADSNRMGFRLGGKPITLFAPLELVSSAVTVGTVQLLPDGKLIVLMADHQTTGGYPRIAHVISHDLPLLAQLGTNDKTTFRLVDIKEAEELAIQFEKNLSFLRAACRFQANSYT